MTWLQIFFDPDLNTLLIVFIIGWIIRLERRVIKQELVGEIRNIGNSEKK